MNQNILEIRHLSKDYGTFRLKDVSFSLPRGGSPQSCLVYEDGVFTWLTLAGEPFHWEALPPAGNS